MAQYDYQSDDGEIVTIERSIHETPVPYFRSAEDKVYRRVFHPLGIVYNTMGFYKTDSADSIEQWRRENMKGL